MNRADIEAVIEKIPDLNDFGVGLGIFGRGPSKVEWEIKLNAWKEDLLASELPCTMVCKWLEDIEKTKTINDRWSSCGLKHLAEKEIGYITNGVFIAAAIYCGFPFQLISGSPNVHFGMSQKSLKAKVRMNPIWSA